MPLMGEGGSFQSHVHTFPFFWIITEFLRDLVHKAV